MIINYSEEKLNDTQGAIFLAGPVERGRYDLIWRDECIKLFEKYNYDKVLYIPVAKNRITKDGDINIIDWEIQAMDRAKVILFWMPRKYPNLLGLTSNVEFGRYLNSKKIVYGRPDNAYMTEYLDILYKKYYNQNPCNTLEEVVKKAILLNN